MEIINRSALVFKPRAPYYEWLRSIPGDIEPDEELMAATVLLIPDSIYPSGIEAYVRQIFDRIFRIQLESIVSDADLWPADRSYEHFLQWVTVEVHPLVIDALEDPIHKEPY